MAGWGGVAVVTPVAHRMRLSNLGCQQVYVMKGISNVLEGFTTLRRRRGDLSANTQR